MSSGPSTLSVLLKWSLIKKKTISMETVITSFSSCAVTRRVSQQVQVACKDYRQVGVWNHELCWDKQFLQQKGFLAMLPRLACLCLESQE